MSRRWDPLSNQLRCEVCETTLSLVEHHVSYEPEVKTILCRKHHAEEHAKDRRKRKPNTLLLSRKGVAHIPDVIRYNLQVKGRKIPYLICPDIVLLYNPDGLDKLAENLEFLLAKVYHMNGDLDKVRGIINTTGKVAPLTSLSCPPSDATPDKVK